jgi:CheY-like chemotaxis protein
MVGAATLGIPLSHVHHEAAARHARLVLPTDKDPPLNQQRPQVVWPPAGSVFADRFELGEPGEVRPYEALYPARDRLTHEEVVLRMWPRDSSLAEAYRNGVGLVRKLQDPWIVKIFDFGLTPSIAYAIMERASGKDLESVIASQGPLTTRALIPILRGAGTALAAAHESEILHRNLQTQKVMVDRVRPGRVLDFGLALKFGTREQLQSALNLPGDPAFAPPERFTGRPLDGRSDIYSLGLIIQQAYTGLRPYAGKSVVEIIASKTRNQRPPMASERGAVPESIVPILEAATSRDPGERPADISSFLNPIGDALNPAAGHLIELPEDLEDLTPSRRGSVLVVDDDGTMRMMLKALFEGAGLDVITATDGAAAWEAIRRHPKMDLVCTDLQMPGMHGHELIRFLRRTESLAETPVVVMSGEEGDEPERVSEELGVAFHIKKPVSIEDFQGVVNHFFGDL